MKSDHLETSKREVAQAGFRPAPAARFVWTIRKLLWPFIRQYHFYHVEKIAETEERLDHVQRGVDRALTGLNRALTACEALIALPGQVENTRTGLDTLVEDSARKEEQILALSDQCADLRGHIATCQERANEIEARLTQPREEFSVRELRSAIASVEAENEQLREELSSAVRQLQEFRADLQSASSREEQLLQELRKFTLAHAELRSDLAAVQHRQRYMPEEVQSATLKQQELRKLLQDLEERSSAMHVDSDPPASR